jgi:hypothetical protein
MFYIFEILRKMYASKMRKNKTFYGAHFALKRKQRRENCGLRGGALYSWK